MDFLQQAIHVNINFFGTYASIVVLVFLFIIFLVITLFIESHKIVILSLLLNSIIIAYLVSFILLVNSSTVLQVYMYSKYLYFTLVLFIIGAVFISDVISKKKYYIASSVSIFFGFIISLMLFGSDYLLITRAIQLGTYPSAIKGNLFFIFQVFTIIVSIYIAFDMMRILKQDSILFKEVWIFYIAILFYLAFTLHISFKVQNYRFYKPALYVNSLVYSLLLLIYIFKKVKLNIVERETYYESYIYDELTSVYTRAYALEILNSLPKQSPLSNHFVAIIDIDKFKLINDSHGHHTGDLVLQLLGRILTQLSKESALCGRLGGDEFIIIFMNISQEKVNKLLASLCDTYLLELSTINPEILKTQTALSVGCISLNQSMTLKDILSLSDQAMYKNKEAKSQFR